MNKVILSLLILSSQVFADQKYYTLDYGLISFYEEAEPSDKITTKMYNEVKLKLKAKPKLYPIPISETVSQEYLQYKGIDLSKPFFALDLIDRKVMQLKAAEKQLMYLYNEAGGGVFLGTLGVRFKPKVGYGKYVLVVNDKENPFKVDDIHEVKWKLLADKTKKREYLDRSKNKVIEMTEFFDFSFKSIVMKLKHRSSDTNDKAWIPDEYEVTIQTKNGEILKKLSIGGDYQNLPEQIFIGQWLKDGSINIYMSSTGKGQDLCGHHFIINPTTNQIKEIQIPCGSWGC